MATIKEGCKLGDKEVETEKERLGNWQRKTERTDR